MYVYFTYIQLKKSEFSILTLILEGEGPTRESI